MGDTKVNLKEKSIFISYGHDAYAALAERLAADLKAHVKSVWLDQSNIHTFNNSWPHEIEEGITNCDIVLALMTKHAYRRPSGVCMNEIVFASNQNKVIRPILVENMQIPLILCTIQYFDILDVFDVEAKVLDEAKYIKKFNELIAALEHGEVDFNGYLQDIQSYFRPQDNRFELSSRTQNFTGRQWLFDRYADWHKGEGSIFFLIGGPGSGKSTFLSKLVMSDERIKGIHFCKYNDINSGKLRSVIKTLSYYLLTQSEEYANYIGDLDLQTLDSKSEAELFNVLIVKPLVKLKEQKEPIIVAIDAVDEMDRADAMEFIKLLSDNKQYLPEWFKLILSSRDNYDIVNKLQSFSPVVLDVSCEENFNDLREYILKSEVAEALTENDIQAIIKKSNGIIQYVKFAIEEIKKGGAAAIEELPVGLSGIYECNFDRFFKNQPFDSARKILEIICAACEPLTIDNLAEITGDRVAVMKLVQQLGAYLRVDNGKISFFHKSLNDWLTGLSNINYALDIDGGHRSIAKWVMDNVFCWEDYVYFGKYAFNHLYRIKDFNGICELLNEGLASIDNSFINFAADITVSEGVTKKFIALIRFISTKTQNCLSFVCKIVKNDYERGKFQTATEICEIFKDVKWLQRYPEFLSYRFEGDLTNIKLLGAQLCGECRDESILLDIYDYIGDAYRLSGELEDAFKYYCLAINSVPENERTERCFNSMYNYYDLRYVLGFINEARSEILKYSSYVSEDHYKMYRVHRLLGNICMQCEQKEKALEHFTETLHLGQKARRPYSVAEAYYSMAESLVGVDNDTAQDYVNKSRQISTEIHAEFNIAKTYFADVEIAVDRKEWDRAIKIGEEGTEKLSAMGYIFGIARMQRNMAVAYFNKGDYKKALETGVEALNNYRKKCEGYPIAILKSFLLVLQSAEKLGKLHEYAKLLDIESVPNLNEFPNSAALVDSINKILNK